ncbi:MAG: aminomethyl transferase family protein, partial [Gammaproteobacteria bacterium]|nr:aminomethyl transferase family protein [Gammaproteobacteria bacterium]
PVRALRVNYVGELGWELHPPMADLEAVYDAVMASGAAFDIANFGLYAVNSLRMEKAYRSWGAELTNEVNMLEADMARFIKLDKADFVGKAATLRAAEAAANAGPQTDGQPLRLIYFEVEAGDSDVRGGEPIFTGERCVGVTTSGAYGHYVRKSLGFGYVPPALAAPGSDLQVRLLGERRRMSILDAPAYDPASKRLRA